MRPLKATLAVTAFWFGALQMASAQQGEITLGILTCDLEEPAKSSEAATSGAESRVRNAACTFKGKAGNEEEYTGQVQGVSLSPDARTTVIWVVKGDRARPPAAGLLEQSYAADPGSPADSAAPMIGEPDSSLSLQSMSDKPAGSVSDPGKAPPKGYVITGLRLKLKSTSA